MESLIVIVGFLGAGKTTLLKKLVKNYLNNNKKNLLLFSMIIKMLKWTLSSSLLFLNHHR